MSQKIWFTSDQHFGHRRIIEYCKRPFASVEEMNDQLIQRHNALVQPDDRVYHLGDFALMTGPKIKGIVQSLNGQHVLIKGNHDHESVKRYMDFGFFNAVEKKIIPFAGEFVTLHHSPYDPVFNPDEGGWLFCGHVHEAWKTKGKMINVGVDVWDYAPVSVHQLRKLIWTHPDTIAKRKAIAEEFPDLPF